MAQDKEKPRKLVRGRGKLPEPILPDSPSKSPDSDFDKLYNPEITDLEKNEYQGKERPVIYLDGAKELSSRLIAEARIEAELYGRLHETIELFQHGAISSHRYSMRHAELTDELSELRNSHKDKDERQTR